MAWRTVNSKVIFEHPRITLLEDIVELPTGQQVPYLKYGSGLNSAMVICERVGMVLLQKEYSYPPNEVLYQFPGGRIEKDETPQQAAVRELAEEAGLQAGKLKEIGWFYFDNRRSDNKLHVFLATDLSESHAAQGDVEEEITSHWTPIDQVNDFMKSGKIHNVTLLAGWAFYMAHLNES